MAETEAVVEAVGLMSGIVCWEVTEPGGVVDPRSATAARAAAKPPVWLDMDRTELILPAPRGPSSASEEWGKNKKVVREASPAFIVFLAGLPIANVGRYGLSRKAYESDPHLQWASVGRHRSMQPQ